MAERMPLHWLRYPSFRECETTMLTNRSERDGLTMSHNSRLFLSLTGAGLLMCGQLSARAQSAEQIRIDSHTATTPFPHFWEQTFGSGRAVLSLREDYRNDLRSVKQITNFDSVRFHGILMDDVGLYDPDRRTQNPGLAAQAANDASVYNFSYVDQIYDGLLANGVRPFVELSF